MAIVALRVLPPIAIGRLGSAATPQDAFDLEVSEARPLDYRRIVPRESFKVDPATGELSKHLPHAIRFKEADRRIRPVAPFLEVYAITGNSPGELVPLTLDLLKAEGLGVAALHWTVEVGNIKAFRRTGKPDDKIIAKVEGIRDHRSHHLLGQCPNFLPGRTLPLGSVRFIKPTAEFPQIRLRFTPAAGKVYGGSKRRHKAKNAEEKDPVIHSDDLVLYDIEKGTWRGYTEAAGPALTNPAQIFAGINLPDGSRLSWGYLDDECDGLATITLALGGGREPLTAHAWIGAGPPAFAPDTLPVRVISDELEQILLGPEVGDGVPIDQAEEIVRRALETVRHMNTAIMNGNAADGRLNVASTMARQDTNDFERYFEPIMATSLVDNLAVIALHERVFNGLSSGAAPWFSDVLRRPEEIGDLSNEARRKMPGMMRNADGRALTLTRRQISVVVKAAARAMFAPPKEARPKHTIDIDDPGPLVPSNLAAQIHHRGEGNPFSVLPRTAISNCFPGLEFDFRNVWRRAFEGIVLLENNNYVVEAEDPKFKHLVHRRLITFDGHATGVETRGPVFPNGDTQTLATQSNPNAVSFMEWSNSLARIMDKQGQEVVCEFTEAHGKDATIEVLAGKETKTIQATLRVRKFFEDGSAAFAEGLLHPGELTQGLCSPWQNDYRECACYYWAASRPDYVNVEAGPDGLSHGDMWLSKKRTGKYVPDGRFGPDSQPDSRLANYDDLFKDWERWLHFIVRGRDAEVS